MYSFPVIAHGQAQCMLIVSDMINYPNNVMYLFLLNVQDPGARSQLGVNISNVGYLVFA